MKYLKLYESFSDSDKNKMVNRFLFEWIMIKIIEKERFKLEPVHSIDSNMTRSEKQRSAYYDLFRFDNGTTVLVIGFPRGGVGSVRKIHDIFSHRLWLLTKKTFSKDTKFYDAIWLIDSTLFDERTKHSPADYYYLFKNAVWHLWVKNNPSGEYILRKIKIKK